MSIKVLVISNYKATHTVRPEAEIFIGLAEMGFDIHIMTYKEAEYGEKFEAAGIKVIHFHPKKKFNKEEIQFIRSYIKAEGIQILQLFNNKAIVNGIQAARGTEVKVVLYRGYSANINWWDPTMYIKFLHPRVDKIFCNSQGVTELLQRQLFFKKSKALTINKGHRLEWYENYKPADIKSELKLPENAFLLINVANNRRMKGIPYLLEAMNNIPEELPIHLLLVGNNYETNENLSIMRKGNNTHRIHFLGFRTDVLNLTAGADLFVLSSIKGESITKSVIQSMCLGTPAVITDIAGNRELLEHGKSGLVVPSKNPQAIAEAILNMYHNRNLCSEMGKAAKQYIQSQLNSATTIQKVKKLYENLLSES